MNSSDRLLGGCVAMALVLLTLGCSSADSAPEPLSSIERGVALAGAGEAVVAEQFLRSADSFVAFDPTLQTALSAEENAAAISTQIRQSGGGCVQVSVVGTAVTARFSLSGCAVSTGVSLSGTVTLTVSKAGGTLRVDIKFEEFAVDGDPLNGTASLVTSTGSTFDATFSLVRDVTHVGTVRIVGSSGSFTLSGDVKSTAGTSTTAVVLTSLVMSLGKCYASAGTAAVTQGKVTTQLAFNSSTPTTGKVQATVGRKVSTLQLPEYGHCPPVTGDGG